ncbi:MAG: tRNA pseudouridine(38-40) synthase TruA, partial [Pseudomonadota bacterium]
MGWQRQDNGLSVQEALEDAVFAFCAERVTAYAAGRTDSGVHALAMTSHIDLQSPHEPDTVRDAINHHLGDAPIAVLACAEAAEDFHARFSAIGRRYRYRIIDRRPPLALEKGRAFRVV